MAEQKAASGGKMKKIVLGLVAVAIVIGLAVLIGLTCFGPQRTVKSTVEGYLTALYGHTLIREMQPYLVEDIREMAFNEFTGFGMSANYLIELQREKEALVGENMTISVIINKETSGTAAALKSASKSYGASALMDVNFTVVFKGDTGSADFTGIARVVKVSGKWYLTEYNITLTEA